MSDEASKHLNIEYRDVHEFMFNFCRCSWQDVPAECSRTAKIKVLLRDYVLGGERIFGEVKDYALK
jgi:hypothetical protein